jgi:hypothetical protein
MKFVFCIKNTERKNAFVKHYNYIKPDRIIESIFEMDLELQFLLNT